MHAHRKDTNNLKYAGVAMSHVKLITANSLELNSAIDSTRLTLLLNELRLPAIKHLWPQFTERSDKEGWPASRLLMALAEHEVAERDRRRIERNLGDAKLLTEKTLENFDFDAVPMISKAQVSALCAGDGWLENGANLTSYRPGSQDSLLGRS
jgi:DNA replication protein DnaC